MDLKDSVVLLTTRIRGIRLHVDTMIIHDDELSPITSREVQRQCMSRGQVIRLVAENTVEGALETMRTHHFTEMDET